MGSVDNERERRIFMDSILFAAINIVKNLYIRCEFGLNGENDSGFGDYVIFEKYSDTLICIGEGKKLEMTKTVAQLTPELISALEVIKFYNLEVLNVSNIDINLLNDVVITF